MTTVLHLLEKVAWRLCCMFNDLASWAADQRWEREKPR